MVIRASSSAAIDALLGDLASDHEVTRESAVARLTILGARAVGRLAALVRDRHAAPRARIGALHTLAGIRDSRGLAPALEAMADVDRDVTVAAIGVARAFLDTPQGMTALDRLTAVVLERDRTRRPEVHAAMAERVGKVLTLAALHGHETAVLGAWGCGVFGNDPAEVAGLFRDALAGPFRGTFARVLFAVLDTTADRRTVGPFLRAFA